jgi:ubiquitin-activating enzyme E1 C
MQWIFEKAVERADLFGIRGVTLARTQGVVKNIIPAIASTNALIAALCALEAFKLVTFSSQTANNYVMYLGDDGVNARTFPLERRGDGECLACRTKHRTITLHPDTTLSALRRLLGEDLELQLHDPALGVPGKSLYFPRPPALERQLHANLARPVAELLAHGESTSVSDRALPAGVTGDLTIKFDDATPIELPE